MPGSGLKTAEYAPKKENASISGSNVNPMRFPSGTEAQGEVFYRGVDAAFATQRDVSRTKRDIKTFEIRLRCDNKDRRLAVGMTAYVLLPVAALAAPSVGQQ